jgi:hypothetical protein
MICVAREKSLFVLGPLFVAVEIKGCVNTRDGPRLV